MEFPLLDLTTQEKVLPVSVVNATYIRPIPDRPLVVSYNFARANGSFRGVYGQHY